MIVGTAGHVDHGKTSLVRALTGIDTDRLKEEKARGITIDLGFAYMPGPDGTTIGFVDVPGHERLVRTMVAGAAGIDVALVVVAGDDGVMPQTREHLDILHLLGLTRGLIAITKCDRIDPAQRAAVRREIAAAVVGTGLADADVLFVSAATGEGVEALREQLVCLASVGGERHLDGVFRLSVDRAFTLPGVGTVATGTARSGRVRVHDEVTLLPAGLRARIRSLHVQNHEAGEGVAGQRCALALSGAGVSKDSVARGAWICAEPNPHHTGRFDAEVMLLAGAAHPLGQWVPVHLHCGASDTSARLTVLADRPITPGTNGLAQIALDHPLPLRHGDRFVLRDQNARHTIGGGMALDPRAPARKRRSPERLARLAAVRTRDHAQALRNLLELETGFEDLTTFASDRGLGAAEVEHLRERVDHATIVVGDNAFAHTKTTWTAVRETIRSLLHAFHEANPDVPGMAGEKLRLALTPRLPKPLFDAIRDRLARDLQIAIQGHWIRLPDHVAQLSADDRRLEALMVPLIAAQRFRPPRVRDISVELAALETSVRRACKALVRTGSFLELAPDQFFLRETVVEMAHIAQDLSQNSETHQFTAAEFRDRVNNGRKVAIQILETFDRQGLTRRDGDLRRVVKAPELIFGSNTAGVAP